MKTLRLGNPPLSFKSKYLFIEQHNEVYYKVFCDGFAIGIMAVRDNNWEVNITNKSITEADKEFLIKAASQLK